MNRSYEDPRRDILNRIYANFTDVNVAFLDETYETAVGEPGRRTFYLMAAYVAPIGSLPQIRNDIDQIVADSFWHSTEAQQTAAGRGTLIEMCDYIQAAPASEAVVISVRTPIGPGDATGEEARAQCLTALLRQLRFSKLLPSIRLAIGEKRNTRQLVNVDKSTVRNARALGLIGDLAVHWTSPAVEHALWLPDVVAYAHYRAYSIGDGQYLIPFDQRVKRFSV